MSLTVIWPWGNEGAGKSSSCARVVPKPAQIQLDGSIGQWYNGWVSEIPTMTLMELILFRWPTIMKPKARRYCHDCG